MMKYITLLILLIPAFEIFIVTDSKIVLVPGLDKIVILVIELIVIIIIIFNYIISLFILPINPVIITVLLDIL